MHDVVSETLVVPQAFSLSQTCAPVVWARQRSPRHEWIDATLITVESRNEQTVWRQVTQPGRGCLHITSSAPDEPAATWARRVLCVDVSMPGFTDEVVRHLAQTFPGLCPYADGSLFDGIVTAIIGQSVSVVSAAAAQHKLAAAFAAPINLKGRAFYPLPEASQLADASVELIRSSGVTWKRAEAIQFAAREQMAGSLPDDASAKAAPDDAMRALLDLPLVGRWTAESALLWGLGAPDAHPTGDVALLRAARQAYERPEMTLKDLDVLAEQWRPARAIAARLLWTSLLGVAPMQMAS